MDKDEMLRTLGAILDPIRQHDRPMLREKARQLKQTDGGGWAVGELLERACIHLDACQSTPIGRLGGRNAELQSAINEVVNAMRKGGLEGDDCLSYVVRQHLYPLAMLA